MSPRLRRGGVADLSGAPWTALEQGGGTACGVSAVRRGIQAGTGVAAPPSL